MAEQTIYSLDVPSDIAILSTARAFVESVGVCNGLNPRLVRSLVLAAGEAVTNIVRHAHRDVGPARIQIFFELDPERVALCFLDEGKPFDIEAVPHYDPGELRIGGRGVYLMRALMDDVRCEPRGAGLSGNCLRLVKQREDAEQIRVCG